MSESQEIQKRRRDSDSHAMPGTAHPTDLVLVKGFRWIVIRRFWLFAFLLVILASSYGLYGVKQNADSDARRAYQQDLKICATSNEGRGVLLNLIRQSTVNAQAVKEDPSFSPALNQIIRENKAKAAAFEADAEAKLALRNCKEFVPKP